MTHINWPQFWAIQILLFLMIGNYCRSQNSGA